MAATEEIVIARLGVQDAAAGLVLSTEARWNQNEDDWRVFLSRGVVFGVRDGAGRIIDIAFDPLTWAEFDEVDEVRAGRTVLAGVAAREQVIEAVDDIRRDSLDPYVTIRSSYSLLRASAIQNGETNVQDVPDFESIDEQPATETPDNNGVTEDNSQHSETIQSDQTLAGLETSQSAPMSASTTLEGETQ